MHPLRTRFADDIVTEFLPPSRATKRQRVIIICGGMPGFPGKKDLLSHFSKKGFWAFNPRYRGTWESEGEFLKSSPHLDVLDVINQLPKGFMELWGGNKFKVEPDQIYIVGTSFGGPAALLASTDERVTKVIAISPVIDWTKRSPDEPLPKLYKFTEVAFGRAYNMNKSNFNKLKSGKFYNPMNVAAQIDGSKVLIIHAKDDRIVPYAPTHQFSKFTKSKLVTLSRGGHLGSSLLLKRRFQKIFTKFIKQP